LLLLLTCCKPINNKEFVIENPSVWAEFIEGIMVLNIFLSNIITNSGDGKKAGISKKITANLVIKKDGKIGEIAFIQAPDDCYKQTFIM
jgi:hypothetical protein